MLCSPFVLRIVKKAINQWLCLQVLCFADIYFYPSDDSRCAGLWACRLIGCSVFYLWFILVFSKSAWPVEFCKSLVLWKVSWGLRRLRREEKRVQLEHCASLLAPSSNAVWVSCNREVANARAHYNRIIEIFTQSAVPLFCHLITSYWIGINLHCLSPNKQSS